MSYFLYWNSRKQPHSASFRTPIELSVLGLMDDTRAALAELLQNLVVADRGSDHVAEIVPLSVANGSVRAIIHAIAIP